MGQGGNGDYSATHRLWVDAVPFVSIYGTTDSSVVNLSGDDGVSDPIALPFPFVLAPGQPAATTVQISTDGTITLGPSAPDVDFGELYLNSELPDGDLNNTIFAFWDDLILDPNADRAVVTKTIGTAPRRSFVIEFHQVAHLTYEGDTGTENITFQVKLDEGSDLITLHYGDVTFSPARTDYNAGASATIGLQINAEDYFQHSYNEAVLTDDARLRFFPAHYPPSVMSFSHPAGIETSAANACTVVFSRAVQIAPGDVTIRQGTTDITNQASYVYDGATATASFTFPQRLIPGPYSITVSEAVVGVGDGVALDGDGDGQPGGDYVSVFILVDEPPVLGPIANQIVDEGTTLSLQATASDPNGSTQTLIYSLTETPEGAAISAATGVFSWTPTEVQGPGVYRVTVKVMDNGSFALSDVKSFDVTVEEKNSLPSINPIAEQIFFANQRLTFVVDAAGDSDFPLQQLRFSLDSGAPVGAVIDPASGVFTWTPTATQANQDWLITVRVTDDGAPPLSATRTFLARRNVGPTLGGLSFGGVSVAGEIILTRSGQLVISATDPQGIARIQYFIDGALLPTAGNGTGGVALDLYAISDGVHTLTVLAYDAFGAVVEQTLSFTVALATPPAPVITAPAPATLNRRLVDVSGSATPGCEVVLYRNGQVAGAPAPVGMDGSFILGAELRDGSNQLAVAARNRAGEGLKSGILTLIYDPSTPPAPLALTATAQEGGKVLLRWQPAAAAAGAPSTLRGYHLYRGPEPFGEVTASGVLRLTAVPLPGTEFSEVVSDGDFYYRVTAVNQAGTESAPSNQATALADSVPPAAASIVYTARGHFDAVGGRYGTGLVDVRLTMTEPVAVTPFLNVKPATGYPIPVVLRPGAEPGEYLGSFEITALTPSGPAAARLSARDAAGNRGTEVRAGASLLIDAAGPTVVGLEVSPARFIQNDPAAPVAVLFSVHFDRPLKEGSLPQFFYTLSTTVPTPAPIAAVAAGADALSWTVSLPLPASAGQTPENLELSFRAEDDLDNVGQRITPAHRFQVFQGALPGLDYPAGLAAKAMPGGNVQLSWQSVEGSADYEVYRQGPGAGGPFDILQRSGGQTTLTDLPATDGGYAYAVAAVRREIGLESTGPRSPPAAAVADRLPPPAPAALALQLLPTGIRAGWQPGGGAGVPIETAVTYRLYRAAAPIVSLEGLIPVARGVAATEATDANPDPQVANYAVAAADAAGNVSPPSASQYLNAGLLPVRRLAVALEGDGPPTISWQPPTGAANLAGYELFLGPDEAAQRLNPDAGPLTGTTFTDGGYSPGAERRYTVVVLDGAGARSLGRSLVLPTLRAELALDANGNAQSVARGVMNRLAYRVRSASAVPVANARLRVGLAGRDHLSEAFSLPAYGEKIVTVVVGGYPELPVAGQPAPLRASLDLQPNEGERVEIAREGTVGVGAGRLGLELLAESFTRGGNGSARFVLTNTSAEEVQIITADNRGASASPEVRLSLLDAEGKILAGAPLKLNIGQMVFTLANGRSVATLRPGERFTSPVFSLPVPANAPDGVFLRAEIDRLYHHQGQDDQVTLEGTRSQTPLALVDTTYTGAVTAVSPSESNGDQPIVIQGRASVRAGGQPAPNARLLVKVAVEGFERVFDVVTDQTGNFSLTYTPVAGEMGGIYSVWAVHPDLSDRAIQAQFTLRRVSVSPGRVQLLAPLNLPQGLPLKVSTGPGTTATGLALAYEADDQPGGSPLQGITFETGQPIASLGPNGAATLNPVFRGDGTAPRNGTVVLRLRSQESGPGGWGTVQIQYALADTVPLVRVTPSDLLTGASPGAAAVTETVELENVGLAAARSIHLDLLDPSGQPAPAWATLAGAAYVDSLAVGEKKTVALSFAPPAGTAEGESDLVLRVTAANHPARDLPIHVAVVTSGKGAALVKVLDAYSGGEDKQGNDILGVTGARVQVQNESVATIFREVSTDVRGEASFIDLPAGNYRLRVAAERHEGHNGRLRVRAGATATEVVVLPYNPVTIDWEVVPTTIQDRYEIVLNATFETDVPMPVVVTEPAALNVPPMCAGDVYRGEFTLTNYGLVRADNVRLQLPPDDAYFRYELLAPVPERLEANERIRVPYRITALQAMPGNCPPADAPLAKANGAKVRPLMAVAMPRSQNTVPWRTASFEDVDGGEDAGFAYALLTSQTPRPTPSWVQNASGGGGCFGYLRTYLVDYCYVCPYNEELVICGRAGFAVIYNFGSCGGGGGGGGAGWVYSGGGAGYTGPPPGWGNPGAGAALARAKDPDCFPPPPPCPGPGNNPPTDPDKCKKDQDPANLPNSNCPQNEAVGSWVNLARRQFEDEVEDMAVKVPGAMLRIQRRYYDQRWHWGYLDQKLLFVGAPATPASLLLGRNPYLPVNTARTVFEDRGNRIARQADGTWLWTSPAADFQRFGADGRLLAVGQRQLTLATMLYEPDGARMSGIADAGGRQVYWFEYATAGATRPSAVRDLTNRRVVYGYGNNLLTSVTDVGGEVTAYAYDIARRLTRKDLPGGDYEEIIYSGTPKAAAADALAPAPGALASDYLAAVRDGRGVGKSFEYGYDAVRRQYYAQVKTSGGQTKETWFNRDGHIVARAENGETKSNVTYDGRTEIETDALGRTTRREKDEWGYVTRETYADGTFITTAYHPVTHQPIRRVDERGVVTEWRYNAAGNLSDLLEAVGSPVARTTTYTYDLYNQRTLVVAPGNRQTAYQYDAAGNVAREYDPANPADQTAFTYDIEGRRLSSTDALNRTTLYTHDDALHVRTVTDALGQKTILISNAKGQLIEEETGRVGSVPGRVRRYEYDDGGRRTKTWRLNDANRPRLWEETIHDADGRPLVQTNALGQRTLFTYDGQGWLTKRSEPLTANATADTLYEYDAAGNLTAQTDPSGTQTTFTYDLRNRLSKRVEAAGTPLARTTRHRYDEAGNLSSVRLSGGGDPRMYLTAYTYDALRRRTGVSGDREPARLFEYDLISGDLVGEVNGVGHRTAYRYDGRGRRTETRDHDGELVAKTTYDVLGNVLSQADGAGNRQLFAYDALNRQTARSRPVAAGQSPTGGETNWPVTNGGWLVQINYNAWGEATGALDAGGGTTSAQFNRLGRRLSSTDAAGLTLSYTFDALDRVVATLYPPVASAGAGAAPTAERQVFDPVNGRLAAVIDRAGLATTFAYRADGQITGQNHPANGATAFTYDALGRPERVTNARGETTVYAYNALDLPGTITYPDHVPGTRERIEVRSYDGRGQLVSQTGAGAYALAYGYDDAGRMQTMTDGNNATTRWAYDVRGRPVKKTYADGSFYAYTYDSAGNLETRTDAKSLTTAYRYNAYHLPTDILYPNDPDVVFEYDSLGRRQAMIDATGRTEWGYDPAGRMTLERPRASGRELAYGYDAEGRRTALEIRGVEAAVGSGVQTLYRYDEAGRLEQVADQRVAAPGHPFLYRRDGATGLLQSVETPFGIRTENTYDALGRLESTDTAALTPLRSQFAYQYDEAGQRRRQSGTAGVINFDYDAQRQLTGAAKETNSGGAAPFSFGFRYDPIGNRADAQSNGVSALYTPNNLNQYTAIQTGGAAPVNPGYDANGNLLNDGAGKTLVFDEENRLVEVRAAAGGQILAAYRYDGLGRRVTKRAYDAVSQTTRELRFLYDGWLLAEERDGTNLPANGNGAPGPLVHAYAWGLDLSGTLQGAGGVGGLLALYQPGEDGEGAVGGHAFTAHHDGRGNVTSLLSDTGLLAARYEYGPFGELLQAAGYLAQENPLRWSTKYQDQETGWSYYGYRFYQPQSGRWVSRDPLGEKASRNLFTFIRNRAVDSYDFLGLSEGPSFGDQINPFNFRGNTGNRDYSGWFNEQFPNSVRGAKQLLQKRIRERICSKVSGASADKPLSMAWDNDKDDVDISPDMGRFGDAPQGWWRKHVDIGNFEFKLDPIDITWVTGCSFNFKAIMYVEEQTGADNPFIGRMEEDVLWFTGMFVKRKVRMAEWMIGGTGTCRDCCEFVFMRLPGQ